MNTIKYTNTITDTIAYKVLLLRSYYSSFFLLKPDSGNDWAESNYFFVGDSSYFTYLYFSSFSTVGSFFLI
jgi:hypothetical protein